MTENTMEPQLKDIPAQRMATMEHKGSYDEIGDVYREVAAWIGRQGATVSGKGRTHFLDAPREGIPEAARYMVCIPVEGDVDSDDRVKVQNLPAVTVYAYTHKGPYSEIPAKYAELMAWAAIQQLQAAGPPFEIYHKAPKADGSARPSEYVTEICLPVEPQ